MGDYDRIVKEVSGFVEEVARAIRAATNRLGDANLKVDTATIELATAVTKKVDGTFDLKIIEIGGEYNKEDSHTVTLEFKLPDVTELGGDIEEELINGIEVIELAVAAAQQDLKLDSGTISVKVGRTKNGQAKIFSIGGEASKEYAHTVDFKLLPA